MIKGAKFILLAFSFFCMLALSGTSVYADSKYGSGEDSIACIKNLSLYNEYYKQNNYKDALVAWRKVFNNCPKASKNTYIHGAKMYKNFIEKAKDKDRKASLVDTLMLIYDQRVKMFGQEGSVLGSKGSDLLKYQVTEYEKAYTILARSIELQGKKSKASVVSAYFQAVVFKFKEGKIDKTQALEEYGKVMEIVDAKLTKKPDDKYFVPTKDILNKLLIDEIKPDCETMVSLMQPKYDATPTDVDLLKKIISTLDGSCEDTELYLKAVVSLADIEKSADSYTNIAKMYYKKGDKAKSAEFYAKATELETDNVKKSKLLLEHAMVVSNNVSQSVSLCKQAISANSANGTAYLLLARHYAAGNKRCSEGDEQAAFLAKAVYWVAVDYCQKAKAVDPSVAGDANSLIASYSAQFPGSEEVFFQGLKEGDSFSINCWFSATTTVRARK